MRKKLLLWNGCVGSMDAITGILLMCFPSFTLELMQLPAIAGESMVFLSWIGAFVFSTGAAYFLVMSKKSYVHGPILWRFTSLVRCVIAIFVSIKVATNTLPLGWLTVAITDAFVAIIQLYGLRKQWWQSI